MGKQICVIGGGHWGENHIRTLHEMGNLGAVVDMNVARLEELKEKYGMEIYTDLDAAIAHGYDEVRLCCALGGSLDHLLANVQSLHFAAEAGLRASAADGKTELLVLRPGEYRFEKRLGWKFSVFALTDRVEGVTIRGSKYDVEDAELTNAFPLGVGNDFKTDISLDFCSGIAAVLLCDRGE